MYLKTGTEVFLCVLERAVIQVKVKVLIMLKAYMKTHHESIYDGLKSVGHI